MVSAHQSSNDQILDFEPPMFFLGCLCQRSLTRLYELHIHYRWAACSLSKSWSTNVSLRCRFESICSSLTGCFISSICPSMFVQVQQTLPQAQFAEGAIQSALYPQLTTGKRQVVLEAFGKWARRTVLWQWISFHLDQRWRWT